MRALGIIGYMVTGPWMHAPDISNHDSISYILKNVSNSLNALKDFLFMMLQARTA